MFVINIALHGLQLNYISCSLIIHSIIWVKYIYNVYKALQ